MMEQIEQILDRDVRPNLRVHGGDVAVVSVRGDVLTVRLLGQCSGCPSAYLTAEDLIQTAVTEAIPQIRRVVLDTAVSEDLMEQARKILRERSQT